MVGNLPVAIEQGGVKEVSLIEKQMNGLVGVVGEAARILPTLGITRGVGEMIVPHETLGVRGQIKADLAFSGGQIGDITVRQYETGTAVTVMRGVKDSRLGGVDWKSDTFMQVGYKKDGDVKPDGLKIKIKLEEKGLEEAELHFDADGALSNVQIDQEYKDKHKGEKIGETQEDQKRWMSDKLGLVLNRGDNGFKRSLDINKTVVEFTDADDLKESPFGKNLKVPALVFKS